MVGGVGLGFRVKGLVFRVTGSGVQGFGVQGLKFRVLSLGYRV